MGEREDMAQNTNSVPKNVQGKYFGPKIEQTMLNDIIGEKNSNTNAMLLECLKEKLHSGKELQHILPVLGTGVSIPAGIPDWCQLLDNMWHIYIKTEFSENMDSQPGDFKSSVYKCIRLPRECCISPPHGNDLLEYAEYLRTSCYKESSMSGQQEDYVNNMFIHKVREGLRYPDKKWDKNFFLNNAGAELLRNICELVKKHSLNVITYNFDDFLEACMQASGASFKSISDANTMYGQWDIKNKKIYHVHGCVRLTNFSGALESKSIVLAESEYMLAEKYTYDWLNAVQAERLHRKDMMIIGFSAQDYNFKRILHNLSPLPLEEQVKLENELDRILDAWEHGQGKGVFNPDMHIHFIFLPVEDFLRNMRFQENEPEDFGLVAPTDKQWRDYICFVLRAFIDSRMTYLRKYGILPIWTSYETLLEMLKYLLRD